MHRRDKFLIMINLLFFFALMDQNVSRKITTLFGLAEIIVYERYLEIPTIVGRNCQYC